MFKRPFSFKGRICRTEYICTIIFILIANGLSSILFSFLTVNEVLHPTVFESLFHAIGIIFIWIIFAQGSKRCHDSNRSGWFQFVPVYSLYLLLIADGKYETNKYGVNPIAEDEDLSIYYFNCGLGNQKKKKYNEAIINYKKSIELNPEKYDVYDNIGFCYLEIRNFVDAENSFNKCYHLNDSNYDALVGLSILYYEIHKYDDSKKWMKLAVEKEPRLGEGMKGLLKLRKSGFEYSSKNIDTIIKINELF